MTLNDKVKQDLIFEKMTKILFFIRYDQLLSIAIFIALIAQIQNMMSIYKEKTFGKIFHILSSVKLCHLKSFICIIYTFLTSSVFYMTFCDFVKLLKIQNDLEQPKNGIFFQKCLLYLRWSFKVIGIHYFITPDICRLFLIIMLFFG